jgi:GNAT superfamily N-acetyltransferase
MNLAEGAVVSTRPVRAEDVARFVRLWTRLSPDTVYRRFHAPLRRLPETEVRRLVNVDHELREAIVAVVRDEVVGVARYDRSPEDLRNATFAVVVEDAWQGQGLGRRLLSELTELAGSRGVDAFTASVQADNRRMLRLIQLMFPGSRSTVDRGVREICGPLPLRSSYSHPTRSHVAA